MYVAICELCNTFVRRHREGQQACLDHPLIHSLTRAYGKMMTKQRSLTHSLTSLLHMTRARHPRTTHWMRSAAQRFSKYRTRVA